MTLTRKLRLHPYAISSRRFRWHRERPHKAHLPSTYKSNDNISETFPKTDRIESWVRFVCGAVFGVFVSLDLVLNFIESSAVLDWVIVGIIIGSGFAAARYGDKFWYSIVQRWWRWP